MKRIFLLFFIAAICLSARAYNIPKGSKLLYYGEQRYERYGMYRHNFYVYELQGKTFLVRLQSFSGALEIIIDADGVARNAPRVEMELSKKQVNKLRETIKNADFIGKIQAYNVEQEEYINAQEAQRKADRENNIVVTEEGDTIYKMTLERQPVRYHRSTMWEVTVDWPGIASNVSSRGSYYIDDYAPRTWKKNGRPARDALINSISNVNALLNDWAYEYKLRNSDREEMHCYEYKTFGGMVRRVDKNGKTLRNGSMICLEEKEGEYYISGYIDEREDTVKVSKDVMLKVEKMVNKLNVKALNPEEKEGEKILKYEASDDIDWEMRVYFYTKEKISLYDGLHSGIAEPKSAAKAYEKLRNDINAINEYLWSFLNLR